MNRIRKNLINELRFNPYSDKFDFDFVLKSLEKIDDDDGTIYENEVGIIKSLEVFNMYFREGYSELKEKILDSKLDFKSFLSFILASCNRNYMLSLRTIPDYYQEGFHLIKSMNREVDTPIISNMEINLPSALEGEVSSCALIINFLNLLKKELPSKNNSLNELNSIGKVLQSSLLAQLMQANKGSYEFCVWNEGKIEYSIDHLHIKNINDDFDKLRRINFYRLNNLLFQNLMYANDDFRKESIFKSIFMNRYYEIVKEKSLAGVYIKEGFIKYALLDNYQHDEISFFIRYITSFSTFNDYLPDDISFKGLSVLEVFILFSLLNSLITSSLVDGSVDDDSIVEFKDFDKFPYRISKKNILNYFSERTTLSLPKILSFLQLLVNKKGERIDFYSFPLYEIDEDYYFPLLTITSPIVGNLIDIWLEESNINLDVRGGYFENFLKSSLRDILVEKGYYYNIPEANKYKCKKSRHAEEIDLIIELDKTIVIAELKCIKFAINARYERNALNRLIKAAEQINRKTEFLLTHEISELSENWKAKEVVKIVVTNFPTFSGRIFDDVVVVDYNLLKAYFMDGKFSRRVKNFESGVEEILQEEVFYSNEVEFNENIKSFLHKCPFVFNYFRDMIKRKMVLSTESASPKILIDYFEMESPI